MPPSGPLKAQLESALGRPVFTVNARPAPEIVSTGIAGIDAAFGGLPRGMITEIAGPACSGRTTLLHSILAAATTRGEACALVDASDAFDPASAAQAGMDFHQLLWIRCAAHKQNALRVTDLLLQSGGTRPSTSECAGAPGGWGMIVLDLADIDPKDARRIPLNAWYRFRLAVENTPTVFLVIGQEAYAGSCSALVLETGKIGVQWHGNLFAGAAYEASRRKPPGRVSAAFESGNQIVARFA